MRTGRTLYRRAAWCDVVLRFHFFYRLSLHILPDVELLDIVGDGKFLVRFLQPDFNKPLDADAQ